MTSAVKKKPRGLWSISEDLHKMEKFLFIAGIVHKNVRTTKVIIFGGVEMCVCVCVLGGRVGGWGGGWQYR